MNVISLNEGYQLQKENKKFYIKTKNKEFTVELTPLMYWSLIIALVLILILSQLLSIKNFNEENNYKYTHQEFNNRGGK